MTPLKSVAQCNSGSVCTDTIVLSYYVRQDIRCKYLKKDTARMANEIVLLKEKVKETQVTVDIWSDKTQLEKDKNAVCQAEVTELTSQNKSQIKKTGVFKVTTIIGAVYGSVVSVLGLVKK